MLSIYIYFSLKTHPYSTRWQPGPSQTPSLWNRILLTPDSLGTHQLRCSTQRVNYLTAFPVPPSASHTSELHHPPYSQDITSFFPLAACLGWTWWFRSLFQSRKFYGCKSTWSSLWKVVPPTQPLDIPWWSESTEPLRPTCQALHMLWDSQVWI